MKTMSYIELIKDFWRAHEREPFSPTATVLYFRLLEESNRKRWKNPFLVGSATLEESVNGSRKMLCKAREELRKRGFISFEAVNSKPTLFTLLKAEKNTGEKEGGKKVKNDPENDPKCFSNVSVGNIQKESNVSVGNISEGANVSQGNIQSPKCFSNVSQGNINVSVGNINTSFINKDNYKDYKDNSSSKDVTTPPPSFAKDIVERFIADNEISMHGFLSNRRINLTLFRELAEEVVGIWAARGWEPKFIEKGTGEYDAPKFLSWISTQVKIRREEEKNRAMNAVAVPKSRDEQRRDLLNFGAESLMQAREGALEEPEIEKPF